jgi:hypothetical protein
MVAAGCQRVPTKKPRKGRVAEVAVVPVQRRLEQESPGQIEDRGHKVGQLKMTGRKRVASQE